MKKSIFKSLSVNDTLSAGASLGTRILLRPHWQKTVFFHGDLGSGKTTFIKGLADGISNTIKVKSPTFNLAVEHTFTYQDRLYNIVHFDLFRLDKNKNSVEILNLLSEKMTEPQTIVLIEWAERLPDNFIFPNNRIEIDFTVLTENSRDLSIKFFDIGVPDQQMINNLICEFATPKHIIKHQEGVAKVADFLAEAIFQRGVFLDLNLVHASAILHDLVRYVNFFSFDVGQFAENVSKQKQAIWEDVTGKYANMHHGDAASLILESKGYSSCAQVISHHKSKAILSDQIMAMEEKIVFFADKKVLHDRIVTVKDRLLDGRVRHAVKDLSKQRILENRIKALGEELFRLGGFAGEEEFDQSLLNN